MEGACENEDVVNRCHADECARTKHQAQEHSVQQLVDPANAAEFIGVCMTTTTFVRRTAIPSELAP